MSESLTNAIIAVDGGGTRCRVALDDGRAICVVETGPANVSTDFDGSVAQLVAGLEQLAQKAGVAVAELSPLPAFLGLAGIIGEDIRTRFRNALPLTTLRVEDDRPAALRGALGQRDGVVAHCGTGSFFAASSVGVFT